MKGGTAALPMAVGLALAFCDILAGNGAMPSAYAATSAAGARTAPCADDGPRLALTGLCADRAIAYLNIAGGTPPAAPEACEWVVQETPFAGQVLLYRAAKCGEKTTRLSYASGAGMVDLAYEVAAYGDPGGVMKGTVLVRVAGAEAEDNSASFLAIARNAIDDPTEAAKCSARKAGIEAWPADALVVDVSAVEAAKAPQGEPRAACGPFGLNEDEASYWRVFQGHSWFFQLGQDALQIDPGSFTLMKKGGDGRWRQAE